MEEYGLEPLVALVPLKAPLPEPPLIMEHTVLDCSLLFFYVVVVVFFFALLCLDYTRPCSLDPECLSWRGIRERERTNRWAFGRSLCHSRDSADVFELARDTVFAAGRERGHGKQNGGVPDVNPPPPTGKLRNGI